MLSGLSRGNFVSLRFFLQRGLRFGLRLGAPGPDCLGAQGAHCWLDWPVRLSWAGGPDWPDWFGSWLGPFWPVAGRREADRYRHDD